MPEPLSIMSAGERCLAAIMFSDVVNYSGQVAENEERTLAAVRRDFQLMSELLKESKGQLLKLLGDGLLASFQSGISAVSCAQAIQQKLADPARLRPGELLLQHRIGIHIGEVFMTDNDVAGHGVNIAARLQGRAEPGGICISQTVFDVVKHQVGLRVNYLGPQELKNLRDTVPAYQILAQRAGALAAPVAASAAPVKPAAASPTFSFTTQKTPATPAAAPNRRGPRAEDEPFRLAIIGDFSGRGSRNFSEPPADRRSLVVDADNFDQVFARLAVSLRLPVCNRPDESLQLEFSSLEQMHPDELLKNIPTLAKLLSLRASVANPSRAGSAPPELQRLLSGKAPAVATPATDSDEMARLLGKAPGTPARPPKAAATAGPLGAVEALIQQIVGTSAVPAQTPRETAALSALDLELAAQLQAILHHPDFQALEAAWRGVQLLVRDFGGEEKLKLCLVDVSAEELRADLAGGKPVEATGLFRLLSAQSWGALLVNHSFGANLPDVALLAQLAAAGAALGAPVLAGARPELAGAASFGRPPESLTGPQGWPPEVREAWTKLSQSAPAVRVALALPRVLLRQPYGKFSDAIEAFPFEELPASRPHEAYLWGNAAYVCAHLLVQAFVADGWDMTPHGGEMGEFPLHRFTEDGETGVKPCAETWLSSRMADQIESYGLTAVLSVKGRDAIQIPGIRSLAAKPLTIRR